MLPVRKVPNFGKQLTAAVVLIHLGDRNMETTIMY